MWQRVLDWQPKNADVQLAGGYFNQLLLSKHLLKYELDLGCILANSEAICDSMPLKGKDGT
jgi:hypothetical protein